MSMFFKMNQCRLPIFQQPSEYFTFRVARTALSRLVDLAKVPQPQTLTVVFDGPKAGKTSFLRQAFYALAEANLAGKVALLELNAQTNMGGFIDKFDTLKRKNKSIVVAVDETIEDKGAQTRLLDSERIYFSVSEEELEDYVFFFSRSCFFNFTPSSFRRIYPFLDKKLSVWNQLLISLAKKCRKPGDLKTLVKSFLIS